MLSVRPLPVCLALSLGWGCAPAPPPPVAQAALPAQISGVAMRRLELPARIGLVRVAGGRVGPVPAREMVRWRGALREVNRSLHAPIRAMPLPPPLSARVGDLSGDLAGLIEAARGSGFDAVLLYELSVRPEDDPLAAGFAAIPLFGGIVPGTVATEAQGQAVALLLDPAGGALMGYAEARLEGAEIANLRTSGGSGEAVQALAEYAALHALIPGAEDMLTEVVAASY